MMFNTKLNAIVPVVFFLIGESNIGGQALNSQLTAAELAASSAIKILNNTTLTSFDNLDIGTNNVVGHSGITVGTTHGFENEIMNYVKADTLTYGASAYMVKAGQGGATMLQFEVGNGAGYYATYLARVTAAKSLLAAAGITRYKPIIIFSIGLNDIGAGTTPTDFLEKTKQFVANARAPIGMGNVPCITHDFLGFPNWTTYNAVHSQLLDIIPNLSIVTSNGISLKDVSHPDAAGYKMIASKMMNLVPKL
jgi:hypothetical protein